jgi:hypothetical protein
MGALSPAIATDNFDYRSRRWLQIQEEFAGHSALQEATLYALPIRLINQIKILMPGMLTADDIHFESRLREIGGSGFCNQRAFASEVLDPIHMSDLSADLYGDYFSTTIKRSQFGLHKRNHSFNIHNEGNPLGNDVMDERRRVQRESLIQRFAERNRAYAGWLVTHPQFRMESAQLKSAWNLRPSLRGTLPDADVLRKPAPRVAMSELSPIAEVRGHVKQFLKRWNVVRFDTWELPVPISAVFLSDDELPRNELKSNGVSIFIPWSIMIDKDLKLDDVINYHRTRHDLRHLDGWLEGISSDKWGVARSSKLMQLYVYLELALKRRYPLKVKGHLDSIDRAFRAYWSNVPAKTQAIEDPVAESKIRQELGKRLGAVAAKLNS